jgi:hypothetical protein
MEPKEAVPLNTPVTIVDPSASVLTDAGSTVDPVDATDCVAQGIEGAAKAGPAPTPRRSEAIAIAIASTTCRFIPGAYTNGSPFTARY